MKVREAIRLLDLRPRSLSGETDALGRCHDVADLRALAKKKLPKAVFDFVDGAADDEAVKARNRAAFDRIELIPRQLTGAGEPNTSVSLLGSASEMPLAIAPCGQNMIMHRQAEPGVARAASAAGIPYIAPAMASATLETIAGAADGPLWFQVYLWKNKPLTKELVSRAKAAGYTALVVTVDTPTSGSRKRDLANGLTIPPKMNWRGMSDAVRHPRWTSRFLRGEMPTFANVSQPGADPISTMNYVGNQFDPGADWDDVAELVSEWDGPVVVKGVLSSEDARKAVDIGAAAVVVSNHGGRQFGRGPATLEMLPAVVEEVGSEIEVFIDSGVMSGADIVAALCLGADACLVGRAAMYGLSAGGTAGVSRALELLNDELRRSMTLLGAASLDDLDTDLIHAKGNNGKVD